MGIILKNGKVLDAAGNIQQVDICIEDNVILTIGKNLQSEGHETIDCGNRYILPGLLDLHVHLRQPGFEEKETVESGTKSAVKGGFTTVACMPNTNPPLHDADTVGSLQKIIGKEAYARVLPIGAITECQRGEVLTDFEALRAKGIVAVSDDGVGVQQSSMMKQAMQRARELDIPVVAHCEDDTLLVEGASVHDGSFAAKYGIPGIPSESESIHIGRDILLSEATGARYHVCHISTKESVRLVREAKQHGIPVTAEVSPHHLLLCEDDIPEPDAMWKMNPPLRSREDQQALLTGLLDGTIDMIATDHAPHTAQEKAQDIRTAPFGIVGFETAFPLLYTHLVETGVLSLQQLIAKLTSAPAKVFGLPGVSHVLTAGQTADLTVVDLAESRKIDPGTFASKGQNTPFGGWECRGWPAMTIVDGQVVWSATDGFTDREQIRIPLSTDTLTSERKQEDQSSEKFSQGGSNQ
jgi:dihydroorotase